MSKLLSGTDSFIHYKLRNASYFAEIFFEKPDFKMWVTNEKSKVSKSKNQEVKFVNYPNTVDFERGNFVTLEFLFFLISKDFSFYKALIFGIEILSQGLTNKQKILHLLSLLKGHKGYARVLNVFQYIVDGSESIIETILYVMLRLPQNKGGFGIKNIMMNKKIEIPSSLKVISHRKYFVADFFIPNKNLTLEYDSTKFHSDRDSLFTDANKRNITELLGYEVITITSKQLYSHRNRMAIYLLIMMKLNLRMRIRTSKFNLNNKKIAQLLPIDKIRSNELG